MTTSRVMAEELAEIVADMVAEELEEKLAEDLAERWRKSWRIAPPTERVTNPGFCLLRKLLVWTMFPLYSYVTRLILLFLQ